MCEIKRAVCSERIADRKKELVAIINVADAEWWDITIVFFEMADRTAR